MSGLFTPIESAELGSTSDFVQSHPLFCGNNWMVMLKGATFSDISRPFYNCLLCFYYKWICCFSYKKPIENFKNSVSCEMLLSEFV
jgi:hypothetical protein